MTSEFDRRFDPSSQVSVARWYFALQALAGAVWWATVPASEWVREQTLAELPAAVLVVPDLLLFVVASAVAAWRSHAVAAGVVVVWAAAMTALLIVAGLVDTPAPLGIAAMVVATVASAGAALVLWNGRLPTEWFFAGPFRFRGAAPTTPAGHLRRSLGQLVVFWTFFHLVVPLVIVFFERRLDLALVDPSPDGLRLVGWTLFAVSSLLGIASCVSMSWFGAGTPLPAATATELVVVGPYRFVRNPMAVAGAGQSFGIAAVVGSWVLAVGVVVGALFWEIIVRPEEEADLERRFGEPYRRYRASVRHWIPGRPRHTSHE